MTEALYGYKLLITVVNRGAARKVVEATKKAGASGGTTIMGLGTGSRDITKIFGIPVETEKEIIFTVVFLDQAQGILETIVAAGKLDKPGHGIVFVVDINKVAGINQMFIPDKSYRETEGIGMKDSNEISYDLIITIVNKGDAQKVTEASKQAGAEGGTIMFGRGTGIHEKAKLFGISIEPEKEIVLTLINRQKSDEVLAAIIEKANLNKPGKGIAFVLEVEKVAGINHALNQMIKESIAQKK